MTRSALLPLTRTGWLVGALGIVAFLVTIVFGWVEVAIIATGCGIALIVALPFVLGVTEFTIERAIEPIRVALDEDASAVLTITNNGPATAPPAIASHTSCTGPSSNAPGVLS